jgi:hypothetical protein
VDPKARQMIAFGVNSPDINLKDELLKAQTYYEREHMVKNLQNDVNQGRLSLEDAQKKADAHYASQEARNLTKSMVLDLSNLADLPIGVGSKLLKTGKTGTELAKVSKSLDTIEEVNKAIQIADKGGLNKVDDIVDLSHSLEGKKGLEGAVESMYNPHIDYENAVELQHHLDNALDTGKLTPQQYYEATMMVAEKKGVAEYHIRNIEGDIGMMRVQDPEIKSMEKLQDVKRQMPGVSTSEAVDIVADQKALSSAEQVQTAASTSLADFVRRSGLDENNPLVQEMSVNMSKTWDPPSVTIHNGKMIQSTIPQQPININFTNPMQRLFHEFSAPYNKAISSGMGMGWDEYKALQQEIEHSVVQPLTQSIFKTDNPSIEQLRSVKSVLGAVNSEITKKIASMENIPGRVVNFTDLTASKMLDDLLSGKQAEKLAMRSSVTDYFMDATTKEKKMMDSLKAEKEGRIQSYIDNHGLSEEEARHLVDTDNEIRYTHNLESPGMTTPDGIFVNPNALKEGEGFYKNLSAVEEHEKLHSTFNILHNQGETEGLVNKFDIMYDKLSPQGKSEMEQLMSILQADTPELAMEEISAYTREYSHLKKNNSNFNIDTVNNDILQFLHNLPENSDLKKSLVKWDEMMSKYDTKFASKRKLIQEKYKNLEGIKDGIFEKSRHIKKEIASTNDLDNKSTLEAQLADLQWRSDRLDQLTRNQFTNKPRQLWRGSDNYYEPRIQHSGDNMYGLGTYTSNSSDIASRYMDLGLYDGLGDLAKSDPITIKRHAETFQKAEKLGKTPNLSEMTTTIEKPLFWDEIPHHDLINSLAGSKSKYVQKLVDRMGGIEGIATRPAEDLMEQLIQIVDAEDDSKKAEKVWNEFRKEILEPNGYDGFVGLPTDNTDDMSALEIVAFDLHNMHRVTKGSLGEDIVTNLDKIKRRGYY